MLAKTYNYTGTDGKKKESFKKDDRYCDHCRVGGHNREVCFKTYGYLELYKTLKEKKAGKKAVVNLADSNQLAETPLDVYKNENHANDLSSFISSLVK